MRSLLRIDWLWVRYPSGENRLAQRGCYCKGLPHPGRGHAPGHPPAHRADPEDSPERGRAILLRSVRQLAVRRYPAVMCLCCAKV